MPTEDCIRGGHTADSREGSCLEMTMSFCPRTCPLGSTEWGKTEVSSSAAWPPPAGDAWCSRNNRVFPRTMATGLQVSWREGGREREREGRQERGTNEGGSYSGRPQGPHYSRTRGQLFSCLAPHWEMHSSLLSCGKVIPPAKTQVKPRSFRSSELALWQTIHALKAGQCQEQHWTCIGGMALSEHPGLRPGNHAQTAVPTRAVGAAEARRHLLKLYYFENCGLKFLWTVLERENTIFLKNLSFSVLSLGPHDPASGSAFIFLK